LEESLALFREIEDPGGLSHILYQRAYYALDQKDYPYVRILLEELSVLTRDSGDTFINAWLNYLLGQLSWQQDRDLRQVKIYYERNLSLFRAARYQDGVNMQVVNLAAVEQAMGNMEQAEMLNEEALLLHRVSVPNHPRMPFVLAGLASAARARGQFERAVKLLGAANSSWLVKFAKLHPEIAPFESNVAALHDQLDETAFAATWEEGRAMTLDQVIAYALNPTL
jgi:tetratricopeptide (TPR) repeat protein